MRTSIDRVYDQPSALLLPDMYAGSAQLLALRDPAAVTTTGVGVARSFGHANGERVPRASGFSRPGAQRFFESA